MNRLNRIEQVHVLGLSGGTLLVCSETRPILQIGEAKIGAIEVKFDQIVALLDSAEGPSAILEFIKAHLRLLVSDSFRVTETYALQSKQAHFLRAAPWYNFARIIRNAFAHDLKFVFTRNDRTLLPAKWRDLSVTLEMESTELPLTFFTPEHAWRLFFEMRNYVRDVLQ